MKACALVILTEQIRGPRGPGEGKKPDSLQDPADSRNFLEAVLSDLSLVRLSRPNVDSDKRLSNKCLPVKKLI